MNEYARKQFIGAVFDYITQEDGSVPLGFLLGFRSALDTGGACTMGEYRAMCEITEAAIDARYFILEREAR